jgi:pilus assembly protein CpaF
MEGDTIMLQDIFVFERSGIDEDGRITGNFVPTGIRPMFLEHLKATSHDLDLAEIEELLR